MLFSQMTNKSMWSILETLNNLKIILHCRNLSIRMIQSKVSNCTMIQRGIITNNWSRTGFWKNIACIQDVEVSNSSTHPNHLALCIVLDNTRIRKKQKKINETMMLFGECTDRDQIKLKVWDKQHIIMSETF